MIRVKALQSALVSEEEFLLLPESQNKVELLDGEVIVSPAATVWHQELLFRIVASLREWGQSQKRPVYVGLSALDVRFAPNRILQPDAFVILDLVDLRAKGPLTRVPEICIEILSTNRSYDRLTKRVVYAEAGVQELWLVDPEGTIERRHGPALGQSEELADRLTSPLLPGFELDLGQLFGS